ncbi:MAG: amidase family protein [Acidimicrobiales bacterium]
MLTATMSIEPPRAGEVLSAVHASGGATALPVLQMAVMTSPFNVTGQPAISLPLHQAPSGLPVGARLFG